VTVGNPFGWTDVLVGLLVYLAALSAVAIYNTLTLRSLGAYPEPKRWPKVAVLVPARNEEEVIERCVASLLNQDYPDFEVLVLDDESSDGTLQVLTKLAANRRLRVLQGLPPPPGWVGKCWACHQLATAAPAAAEVLVFVDADTWHERDMLRGLGCALTAEDADLVSVIPEQLMLTLGEKLTVPLLGWSLFTHFPLAPARAGPFQLAVAVGQVMAFRRDSYWRAGGHAAVADRVAEDVALARLMARMGCRELLVNGVGRARCRMYTSFGGALAGFGKNLFAFFNYSFPLYLFVWCWLALALVGPWAVVTWGLLSGTGPPALALASIGLGAASWTLFAWRLRAPAVVVGLYPIIGLVAFLLAIFSLVQHCLGRASWKGRRLPI
jgi:chlorobactene glucosyltransferase